MKKILVSGLLTTLLHFCMFNTSEIHAGEIKVAVAANVSYAIKDLKKVFNQTHPMTKIQVILGSSGKLTAQIRHAAPYDIFLSANMLYPKTLYKEKIAITKPIVYAQGVLAMLSVKERDFTKNILLLQEHDIEKIAVANPQTAPYGVAAKKALENAKIYEQIKDKLVFGESISQTVAFATTAADIGIIAKSSLFSPQMSQYKEAIHWVDVNTSLYVPIAQGMVILKEGNGDAEVQAFYDFMLSKEAKKILISYGYTVQ